MQLSARSVVQGGTMGLHRSPIKGASGEVRQNRFYGRLEGRGLVIMLSDLFAGGEEIKSGLAHLRHERHEVVVVRVLDRHELEFPFRNWVRFRGLEGEKGKLVEPALMRKTYKENFERH